MIWYTAQSGFYHYPTLSYHYTHLGCDTPIYILGTAGMVITVQASINNAEVWWVAGQ